MLTVTKTAEFDRWLSGLKDKIGKARILARLDRVRLENFGDAKFFDGIGELRIDVGPGYRVYFKRQGNTVVLILCGGDKSSQSRDIAKAKQLAKGV
jgi:putative addiction module killer protein